MSYNHENPSRYDLSDCEAAVGERAKLTLTGTLVEAKTNDKGLPFVLFEVDERWGFDEGTRLGMDLDAFQIVPEGEEEAE